MAHLDLTYFGAFQVTLDGEPITRFRSANVEGLLVYLSLQPDRVFARDVLATFFWPEVSTRVARKNLRQSIFQLRHVFGDNKTKSEPFILRDRKTVQFNANNDYRLDITLFKQAMQMDDWEEALVHYGGELLPGFNCESESFEEWLRAEREGLQQQVLEAMSTLAGQQLNAGEYERAETNARRQLEIIPWQELGHRQLMHAMAAQGQRTAALTQYNLCSKLLMDELGATPSPELDELYDRIEAGEFDKSIEISSSNNKGEISATPPQPSTPPFQAKSVPEYFVKRNDEIDKIMAHLITPPATEQGIRIAALVGMGGAGKTTLAAHLAYELRDEFTGGVLWANTTSSTPQDILEMWGRAYGYDFSGLSDLESRSAAVRGMLAERSTLIVLDNVEDAAHVRPLLPNTPNCACLITTRNLDIAITINAKSATIGELPLPSGIQLLTEILSTARVEAETQAATEICQLLNNLPLAVEITAQQLKLRERQRLSNMAQRLQEAKHRLNLSFSDLAVRTSFAVSWEALDEEQQRIFALLAVFEGRPFAAEAIAHIADADLFEVEEQLYSLVSLSLLMEEDDRHFRHHPLLADFASEKLEDKVEANARMVEYYLKFAEENNEKYEVLEHEWGNLSVAIEVAHRLEKWEKVVGITDSLADAWMTRGRFTDAKKAYALAVDSASKQDRAIDQAKSYLRWGKICAEQSDYEEASVHLHAGLELFACLGLYSHEHVADIHYHLASIAEEKSDFDTARQHTNLYLEVQQSRDDKCGLAKGLHMQALIDYGEEAFDQALRTISSALEIQKTEEDWLWMISSLRLLSAIHVRTEELDTALDHGRRALQLSRDLQNEHEIGTSVYSLVTIYRAISDYPRAESLANEALSLFKRLGQQRLEGMASYQLGLIRRDLEEFEMALEPAARSLAIFDRLDDQLGCSYSFVLIGDIHYRLGDVKEARMAWQQAQAIGLEFDNSWVKSQTKQRLSNTYME